MFPSEVICRSSGKILPGEFASEKIASSQSYITPGGPVPPWGFCTTSQSPPTSNKTFFVQSPALPTSVDLQYGHPVFVRHENILEFRVPSSPPCTDIAYFTHVKMNVRGGEGNHVQAYCLHPSGKCRPSFLLACPSVCPEVRISDTVRIPSACVVQRREKEGRSGSSCVRGAEGGDVREAEVPK